MKKRTMTVTLEVSYQGDVKDYAIKEKVRLAVMNSFGDPYRDSPGILKVELK